jgi:hypothetical protein
MTMQAPRDTVRHAGTHRRDRLARFAADVAAQSLGTVTGAGLLYVAAGWFGMLDRPPARVVVAVLLAAALPAAGLLAPRARHAHDERGAVRAE